MKKDSGLILFAKFAIACIPDLIRTKKITPDEAEYLRSLIKRNEEPSVEFLERHFNYAVRSYRRICEEEKIRDTSFPYEADFSYESVLNHWWNYHNNDHYGDCAVVYGIVMSTNPKIRIFGSVIKKLSGPPVWIMLDDIENPYEEVKRTDSVLIHRRTIVCKVTRKVGQQCYPRG